jgi:hypothetical protein
MRPIDGDAIEAFLRDEYHGAISDSELKVYQVINLIGNAPTIDMVKHGEWRGWKTQAFIGVDEFYDPKFVDRKFYRCSLCRRGTAVKSDFCPKCGAYMREEQEK